MHNAGKALTKGVKGNVTPLVEKVMDVEVDILLFVECRHGNLVATRLRQEEICVNSLAMRSSCGCLSAN